MDVAVHSVGQHAAQVARWPSVDLERRLSRALTFAAAAVDDFGATGYVDAIRPALSFGPEKVIAEATMLAYAASRVASSAEIVLGVDRLAGQLAALARTPRIVAQMALEPEAVLKRVAPHVLLSAIGHTNAAFDEFASDQVTHALAYSSDEPPTVLAEREWMMRVWGRAYAAPFATDAGTPLSEPFHLRSMSREDAYGVTHQLFYATDFGGTPRRFARTHEQILADVEGLLLRYLDHEDYDIAAELLMAWPQLQQPWSATAAFAFRVLAEVEDEAGILPCGNVDAERLASLESEERTRYARAASYHTAFVMGLLCAVALRPEMAPPARIDGPRFSAEALSRARSLAQDDRGDWQNVFDRLEQREKLTLTPTVAGLALTQALRRRDFAAAHDVADLARRHDFASHPIYRAAIEAFDAVSSAMRTSALLDAGVSAVG